MVALVGEHKGLAYTCVKIKPSFANLSNVGVFAFCVPKFENPLNGSIPMSSPIIRRILGERFSVAGVLLSIVSLFLQEDKINKTLIIKMESLIIFKNIVAKFD
jgi:hypothetical protein